MVELNIDENGNISATTYVQASFSYECKCGTQLEFTVSLPENVTFKTTIKMAQKCPKCGADIIIPYGLHKVENYRLVSKFLQS